MHVCLSFSLCVCVCVDVDCTVLRPNMDSYVFIRAVEKTEQVNVDPE